MELKNRLLCVSGLLRVLLVLYGCLQDHYFEVKYTDIDYVVYSDAATLVSQGKSPYDRDTYRYSPLIAWILLPNTLHPFWGKILFCAMDIVVAELICVIVKDDYLGRTGDPVLAACLWLFNPFTFAISTRGSCDSITAAALLSLLFLLMKCKFFIAGIIWAFTIHWRLFPIIYAPLCFFFILNQAHLKHPRRSLANSMFSREMLSFGLGFLASIGSIGVWFYSLYGVSYLDNSFLYHLSRSDPRHNFSFFFYLTYLQEWKDPLLESSVIANYGLGKVLPIVQSLLIVAISFRFHNDLALGMTLTTLVFVAFNKVSTAQYFVWYFCFIPLILARKQYSGIQSMKYSFLLWIMSQGHWLFWAYLLEFQGVSCYLQVWFASVLFFLANVNVVVKLIKIYST